MNVNTPVFIKCDLDTRQSEQIRSLESVRTVLNGPYGIMEAEENPQ